VPRMVRMLASPSFTAYFLSRSSMPVWMSSA